MLHARGNDLDATLRVAVQPAELALLLGAADADGVGAGDDLLFGTMAPLRLQVAAFRLHLGQRVKRADERDVELVLDSMRNQAAEEVVGMHHVGGRFVLEVVDDTVAELGEHAGQLLLGQVEGARRYVHHTMAGLDHHHLRLVGAGAASEGGALHAGLRQRRDQLAHVHVHAATVARARLGQRGGVE